MANTTAAAALFNEGIISVVQSLHVSIALVIVSSRSLK